MRFVISSYSPSDDPRPATLVFRTLRTGFPSATGECHWNGSSPVVEAEVRKLCKANDVEFIKNVPGTTNDEVGNRVLRSLQGIVAFVDADIVFWDSVEDHEPSGMLSGRLMPTYFCPFSKIKTISRLHSSLLFVKEGFDRGLYKSKSRFIPVDYCSPFVVYREGQPVFYDSFANLYHAVGGTWFPQSMLDRYDHLLASSYIEELAAQHPSLRDLPKLYAEVYADVIRMKGLWKTQEAFLQKHAV